MIWNGQMPDDPKYNELDLSCLDRSEVKKMSSRERNWCPQIEANRWWTEWEWWSGVKPRNPGLDSGSENPGSSGEHGPGDDPTGDGSMVSGQPGSSVYAS